MLFDDAFAQLRRFDEVGHHYAQLLENIFGVINFVGESLSGITEAGNPVRAPQSDVYGDLEDVVSMLIDYIFAQLRRFDEIGHFYDQLFEIILEIINFVEENFSGITEAGNPVRAPQSDVYGELQEVVFMLFDDAFAQLRRFDEVGHHYAQLLENIFGVINFVGESLSGITEAGNPVRAPQSDVYGDLEDVVFMLFDDAFAQLRRFDEIGHLYDQLLENIFGVINFVEESFSGITETGNPIRAPQSDVYGDLEDVVFMLLEDAFVQLRR